MEWLENTREFQQRHVGPRASPLEIAVQRIQRCVDRRLDLSNLHLTELPPLPDDLIMLRCDSNELTSLPELPSTLRILHCHQNQLTSLPELPPFLESLSCSNNPITSLPSLPSSLTQLVCIRNYLHLFLLSLKLFKNYALTIIISRNLMRSLLILPVFHAVGIN